MILFVPLHRCMAMVTKTPKGWRLTECIKGFPVGDQFDVSERNGERRCECVTWDKWKSCEHIDSLAIVGRRMV